MAIDKRYIVEKLMDMMTDRQLETYKLFYECGRDKKEVAKRLGIKVESIRQYFTYQKILRLAIEVTDMEEGSRPMTNVPTLEWTMNENMTLYHLAKREFERYDKEIADGARDKVTIGLRDKYQKDMKEMIKQITDHQNKFGEMLDKDALNISGMDKARFRNEFREYVKEFEDYFSKESWAS